LAAQQLNPGIIIARNTTSLQDNGVKYYSDIIDRNPEDVKSILLRAELHRSLSNTEAADRDVDLAMSINPYSFLYLNKRERNKFFARRSYSYYTLADIKWDESFNLSFLLEEEYSRLLDATDLEKSTQEILGNVLTYLENSDFEEAEKQINKIEAAQTDNALYYDLKGVLLLEKGELEEAIAYFNEAIKKDSFFTVAFHNRAVAYKMLRNYDAASRDFDIALNQRADLAKIQFSKAKLLETRGDLDGAKYYYEKAISTENGDYAEARLNYSVLLKSCGEYTRAIIEINDLIEEYPEDVNNYYVRGGLHFIYGEYAQAIEDFDTYLRENPDDADVFFYRGLCLVLDGSLDRGCSDISRSIDKGYDRHDDLYLFMCE